MHKRYLSNFSDRHGGNVDFVIILTLVFIIIIGLASVVFPMIGHFQRYEPPRTSETYFITPRSPRLIQVDTLQGFHSKFYYVNYEVWGYDIYISVYANNVFNLHLYGSGGTIIWSQVNVNTLTYSIPGFESPKGLELGLYSIQISNPNDQKVKYEIFLELRPVG